jgi:PAS domain S-box-containing protein
MNATESRLSVLIVEDSPVEATLTHRMLSTRGALWTVEVADRLAAALKYLAASTVDIILLDLHLPDSRGLPTLVRLREAAPETPIVVLTGTEDEQAGIEALQQGAQDYLLKKQWGSALLSRTLRYAVERFRAEKALRQSEARLRAIVENVPVGICVVDADLRLVDFNPRLLEMLGYSAPELASLPMTGLFFPEDDFQFEIKAVLHDGVPRRRQRVRYRRKGGDALLVNLLAVRPVIEGLEKPISIVMTVRAGEEAEAGAHPAAPAGAAAKA